MKIDDNGELHLLNKCLSSKAGTGCYVSISEDKRYLFEAVYGAGIIRMYELNTHTGEIIRLIQELAHDFPTGTHEDKIIHMHIILIKLQMVSTLQ